MTASDEKRTPLPKERIFYGEDFWDEFPDHCLWEASDQIQAILFFLFFSMNSHVIKIGGENASDLRTAEWLANFRSQWNYLAVAISALRTKPLNTTTELLKAQDAFVSWGMREAKPILEKLFRVHIDTLREAWMADSELEAKLRSLFAQYFPDDLHFPEDLIKQHPGYAKEQVFVWYGEVMSAHVLAHLLDTRFGVANSLVSNPIYAKKLALGTALRDTLGERVSCILEWWKIAVVPWYQSVHGHSILEAYGRWYTDKMAERTAVWLARLGMNPTLHIQKQVALLSSNPKQIPMAEVIERLSYKSAAEITWARWANAQVLNEHTISPELARQSIPVHVYNPFEVDAKSSVISREWNSDSGIQFIDSRDHVTTITVSGFAMSGPGLLTTLSWILSESGISVDSISSSETEVTFSAYGDIPPFEQTELYKKISHVLGEDYEVRIENNLWLIYCIGDHLAGHPGILERISATLARSGIDIECVTQSRGQRAVTVGVRSDSLSIATKLLHEEFIEKP
jgi:aspartate kinase